MNNQIEASAKVRRSACQCIAQSGGGLHSEAKIFFHPFYKHSFTAILTCYVSTAKHYNDCRPPPRPSEAPFGASPGLVEGFTVKRKYPWIFFTNIVFKPI